MRRTVRLLLCLALVTMLAGWSGGSRPTPVTLVSSAAGAVASSGEAGLALDGDPKTAWVPQGGSDPWIAVRLQKPAARTLIVAWLARGYGYLNRYPAPSRYAIQVSGDSPDGRHGTWHTVQQVTGSRVRTRADTVDAPGARWVRLVLQASWGKPSFRELAIFAAEQPHRLNAWFMLGDSITDDSFNTLPPPGFVDAVRSALPTFVPLVIDGGTGGTTARTGALRLQVALPLCPPGSFVALGFGTNDATLAEPLAQYRTHLQRMIDAIRRSGRTPVLARIPWNPHPRLSDYLQVVDDLVTANRLPPGPDLYGWFLAHPEELKPDRIHPNTQGQRSVQRLWGEAAVRIYQQSRL